MDIDTKPILPWFFKDIPKVNLALKATYTGWWYTYPSEKYESQLGLLSPIYGKKHVPNHQPVIYVFNGVGSKTKSAPVGDHLPRAGWSQPQARIFWDT
jgi:hypothetical protein